MKKRITALALALAMVLGTVTMAAGIEKTISVSPMNMTINDQAVTPTKSNGDAAEVFAYDGATYVPLRYLAELLGIEVEWDKNDPNTAKLVNVPTNLKFKAGTYTGKAMGRGGELSVSVTFSDSKIEAIEVLEHNETLMLSSAAFERVPADVVTYQSLNIDAISGATITRAALINAISDAVKQAGGDVAALKAVQIPAADKQADETMDVDVVVVGSGLAGMTAAYEVATAGAKTLLIEKLESLGGTSARSGGVVCYATKEDDELLYFSPDQFNECLLSGGYGNLNEPLVRKLADMSNDNVAWMRETIGYAAPYEMAEAFTTRPDIMTRICNPISPDEYVYGGGGIMMTAFYNALKSAGDITILNRTAAKKLLNNGNTVVGLEALRDDGSKLTVNAKAVILACGGWDYSGYYRDTYAPGLPTEMRADHNTCLGSTGDGLAMCEELGIKVTVDSQARLSSTFKYSAATPENYIIVDSKGNRLVDESQNGVLQTGAMVGDPNYPFFRVFDSKDAGDVLADAEANTYLKADTIEELADLMGVAPTALRATVDRYNSMTGSVDEDFGKPAEHMTGVTEGPFYAVSTNRVSCNGSYGGPAVTTGCEVLTDKGGDVVPGLYGAGEFCNINVMGYDFPHHGVNLQFCLTSGRLSAESAINYIASN